MKTLTRQQITFRNRLSTLADMVEALPKENWDFGCTEHCAFPVMAKLVKIRKSKLDTMSFFGFDSDEYRLLVMPKEYIGRHLEAQHLPKTCTRKQWASFCRKFIKKKYG